MSLKKRGKKRTVKPFSKVYELRGAVHFERMPEFHAFLQVLNKTNTDPIEYISSVMIPLLIEQHTNVGPAINAEIEYTKRLLQNEKHQGVGGFSSDPFSQSAIHIKESAPTAKPVAPTPAPVFSAPVIAAQKQEVASATPKPIEIAPASIQTNNELVDESAAQAALDKLLSIF